MNDPNIQQSESESNGSAYSPEVPPHADDLRNVMSHRPAAPAQPMGSGEFSAPPKSDPEPRWSDSQTNTEEPSFSSAETSDRPRSGKVHVSDYDNASEYMHDDAVIDFDRGHPEAVARIGPPAGFLRRLAAYLFDYAIVFMILSILFPILVGRPYFDYEQIRQELDEASQQTAMPTATPVLPTDDQSISDAGTRSANENPQSLSNFFLGLALALGVTTVYNGLMVGYFGSTVGKALLKVYIVDSKGNLTGYSMAFGRAFGSILSTAIFYIGYLFILRNDHRALHDLLAGTYAVTLTTGELPGLREFEDEED